MIRLPQVLPPLPLPLPLLQHALPFVYLSSIPINARQKLSTHCSYSARVSTNAISLHSRHFSSASACTQPSTLNMSASKTTVGADVATHPSSNTANTLSLNNDAFSIIRQHGTARAGTLKVNSRSLPTPNVLYYAKKGNLPHITPDLLHELPQVQALHVTMPELVHNPGVDVIKRFPRRLHDYVRLPDHLLYLNVRDPIVDVFSPSNDNGVALQSTHGSVRLSPAKYAQLGVEYAPDILVSMGDEVATSVGSNRCKKSALRTVGWSETMQKAAAESSSTDGSSQSTPHSPLFFVTLAGGGDVEQRKQSCVEYCKRIAASLEAKSTNQATSDSVAPPLTRIDGFVIVGLGSGEDEEKRTDIIDATLSFLPSALPRVLSNSSTLGGNPADVLRAVSQGIDLFEVSYPYTLTLMGQAAVWGFEEMDEQGNIKWAGGEKGNSVGSSSSKLILSDPIYARDARPILEGCQCFTCRNHTRAYIHHLINVHEMLAPVLLDLHNLHHYSRFMSSIRAHLSSTDPHAFTRFSRTFLEHFLPQPQIDSTQSNKPHSSTTPSSSIAPPPSPAGLATPIHRNQVGRALLGPFSPVLAEHEINNSGNGNGSDNGTGNSSVSLSGKVIIRRILPKDESQVASIIRQVLTTYGATGPGFAYGDAEVDHMYSSYESLPALPPASNGDKMEDIVQSVSSAASSASSSSATSPLRSGYYVICPASDDSVVVGGGGFAPLIGMEDGSIAELRKMYFSPHIRGQGVGQKLLAIIMDAARTAGFKQLYLETLSTMHEARKLYERNGFVKLDKPLGQTGHCSCDVAMIKQL